jgi:hypothetical protein
MAHIEPLSVVIAAVTCRPLVKAARSVASSGLSTVDVPERPSLIACGALPGIPAR